MKKLIPALCLLLVSALLLGTSTYAWFSMNTKVTASSVTVKATASKNLLISLASDSGFGPSVAFEENNSVDTLVPTSTIGGAAPAFFKLDTPGATMKADNYAYDGTTTFTTAVANTDYVKQTVYIKCTGTDAENLIGTINVSSGGSMDLDPALRVMFVAGGTSYIYEPVSGATASYKGVASVDGETGLPTLNTANQTISSSGTTVILTSLTADEAQQVDIYIWYEGQDTNCKATNAVELAATVFAFDFTVAA